MFGAMMLGAIKMSNSPICGASESACLVESVDDGMCCATTFIGSLRTGIGRSFRVESFDVAAFGDLLGILSKVANVL